MNYGSSGFGGCDDKDEGWIEQGLLGWGGSKRPVPTFLRLDLKLFELRCDELFLFYSITLFLLLPYGTVPDEGLLAGSVLMLVPDQFTCLSIRTASVTGSAHVVKKKK